MAIAFVQHAEVVSSSLTFSPLGSGNAVVVYVGASGAPVLNDDKGNIYTFVTGVVQTSVFLCVNCIPGATLLTSSGGVTSICMMEFSGVSLSSAIDSFSVANDPEPSTPCPAVAITISNPNSVITSFLDVNNPTGASISPPWLVANVLPTWGPVTAYAIPGSSGTYQAVFTLPSNTGGRFQSVSLALLPLSVPLTLTLSDSVSSSDSAIKEDEKVLSDSVTLVDAISQARGQNVSDSLTVTDSFILQSSFLAPVQAPIVEVLVDQLAPAEVKLYFDIVE